ncbi:MAG: hypothetical protein ABJB32_07615 [Verrucomicrobiota bacterium]
MHHGHELLGDSRAISDPELLGRARVDTRFSPLVWLNLVCLDAPIVAVTWQWLFARSFHISLTMPARVALFLIAWFIYLADRFVDTLSLAREDPKSLRQQFCQRHRLEWMALLVATALFDTWLVLRHLDTHTFFVGLIIGALSLVYLATNYWLGKIWRIISAKEICVGSLFAIGTLAALIPKVEHWSASFVTSFLHFAFLCSLNCISIAAWERELDQAQGKNSLATRWPRVGRYLKASALVLAGSCVAVALITRSQAGLCPCIGASASLLGGLDLMRDVIPPNERTALADLVLLTPLVIFLSDFAR